MIDREKVIKGLEICTSMQYRCADCPYYANCCFDGQEVMENALALLKDPAKDNNVPSKWVSVNDRLPEQTPSLFSKYKDTDKWSKAMWVMDSETVLVTVAAKGESIVTTGKLQDGKWCTRISPVIEYKVTHWMPLPEPPKEVSE